MTIVPGIPSNLRRATEPVAWTALAVLLFLWVHWNHGQPLSNDSYQYLSEAHHLLSEHELSTSLVFFDVERAHAQIPAPLTTFPPGYAIAIAALGKFGLGLESAGKFISFISFALTVVLCAVVLARTGVRWMQRQLLMLFLVTNAAFISYGTTLLSELPFTFLFAAAVAGSIWIEYRIAAGRDIVILSILANLSLAAACWVRYAGYFAIAGFFLYAAFQWVRYRNRQRTILLSAALIPVLSAATLMMRNVALTETWKGGNELAVHHRFIPLIVNYVVSQVHVIYGEHAVKFGLAEAIQLVGTLIVFVVAMLTLKRPAGAGANSPLTWDSPFANAFLLVTFCVFTYTEAMFYVGIHTDITFGARMFMPLIPLYCMLLAWSVAAVDRRARSYGRRVMFWLTGGVALMAIGYAAVNARDLEMPRRLAPHEVLASLYALPMQHGEPMIDWFRQAVPPGETVLTEEGQGTGYLLERPTVSMTTSEFSSARWECGTIRSVMDRFHISYVVLYRYLPSAISNSAAPTPGIELMSDSHFVADTLAGQPPCGFVLAAWSPAILVLRSQPDPEKTF